MTSPKPGKADFSDVKGGASSTEETAKESAKAEEQSYTIEKGDTLWKISQRFLGDGAKWKLIHEANKDVIKNPDLIHPGQVIRIPKA